jgi:cell division protein FtsN
MPNYERGAYEPSDEVRVFDGAEDEEDEEGSRLPLLIVMALLVLAAFGGVVWLAYERGVASGRTEPRLLTAEQGPAKVAPSSPGGTESPYKGLKVYDQPASNNEDADNEDTVVKPPQDETAKPAPSVTAMKPVTEAPAARPAVTVQAPAAKPTAMALTQPPVLPAAKPVEKPVAKPAPAPSVAATPKPAPATTVTALPPPAKPKPVETAAAAPAETAPAAPAPAATASGGGYVLQIGAYKSQAEADDSWKTYQAKHSALLSGFSPNVKQVDLGDKGVWYRLRVGGFSDKDAASALCDKLKADGGNCFLAK